MSEFRGCVAKKKIEGTDLGGEANSVRVMEDRGRDERYNGEVQ